MSGDMLVYADRDGKHYIGVCSEGCWRWPAEQDGWARRTRSSQDQADPDREYDAFHARLALKLSGGPGDG